MMLSTKKSPRQYDAVDVAKWICSWMVVYMHVLPVCEALPWVDVLMAQGICRVAVPFFFSTAGFLLVRKFSQDRKQNRKVLLGYGGHILGMYTVWSAVYFVAMLMLDIQYDMLSWDAVKGYIQAFFFGGTYYHLWYLIAIVYAVPLVYLLWRCGRRALVTACVVGCLLQCLDEPYHLEILYDLPGVVYIYENYLLIPRTLLMAIPLISLGLLCFEDHKKKESRQWFKRLIVAGVIYLAELTGVYLVQREETHMEMLLSGPLVVYYLTNWLFTLRFEFRWKWLGKMLRFSSIWIYCIHPLVLLAYSCIFAYRGFFRFAVIGGVSLLSGVIYAGGKILLSHHKKESVAVTE